MMIRRRETSFAARSRTRRPQENTRPRSTSLGGFSRTCRLRQKRSKLASVCDTRSCSPFVSRPNAPKVTPGKSITHNFKELQGTHCSYRVA